MENSNQTWAVIEFNSDWTPKAISDKRPEGKVIFKLKDLVTNGTKMRGKITHFELSKESNEIFVYTDWSGVGMNLDSVVHVEEKKDIKVSLIPATFQPEEFCYLVITNGYSRSQLVAQVLKVSFTKSKVTYDIEASLGENNLHRFYGVDSELLIKMDQEQVAK